MFPESINSKSEKKNRFFEEAAISLCRLLYVAVTTDVLHLQMEEW
jgi:hypothetical protein